MDPRTQFDLEVVQFLDQYYQKNPKKPWYPEFAKWVRETYIPSYTIKQKSTSPAAIAKSSLQPTSIPPAESTSLSSATGTFPTKTAATIPSAAEKAPKSEPSKPKAPEITPPEDLLPLYRSYHKCIDCSAYLPSTSSLLRHVRDHCSVQQPEHTCGKCLTSFTSRNELFRHLHEAWKDPNHSSEAIAPAAEIPPTTPLPTYRATSPPPPTYATKPKAYLTIDDLYMRYAPLKSVKLVPQPAVPTSYLTVKDLYKMFEKPKSATAKSDPIARSQSTSKSGLALQICTKPEKVLNRLGLLRPKSIAKSTAKSSTYPHTKIHSTPTIQFNIPALHNQPNRKR